MQGFLYEGLAVQILDCDEIQIAEWIKGLCGRLIHVYIDILSLNVYANTLRCTNVLIYFILCCIRCLFMCVQIYLCTYHFIIFPLSLMMYKYIDIRYWGALCWILYGMYKHIYISRVYQKAGLALMCTNIFIYTDTRRNGWMLSEIYKHIYILFIVLLERVYNYVDIYYVPLYSLGCSLMYKYVNIYCFTSLMYIYNQFIHSFGRECI